MRTIWKRYANDGYGVLDDLLIEYTGNQLKSVSEDFDDGYGFMDFAQEDVEYAYNANGALISDKNKGMKMEYSRYNCFKTPYSIQVDNPLTKGSIYYEYSFSGKKLRSDYSWYNKQSSFPIGGASGSSSGGKATQYIDHKLYDGYEFEFSLEKILLDNGYIDYKTKKYYFYLRDHLGNNCVVADLEGNVVQRTNYYPFGLPMNNSTGEEAQPYKYNGKEYETILGINQYDYHARQQDPILGRFTSVDPLAEKYYNISPYVYAGNNPIRNIDINGDSITVLNLGTGTNQHVALLIQNNQGKWQYYSVNGNNVYPSGKFMGGRKFDDLAVGEFESPQQFLESAYNSKGDSDDKSIDYYEFTEGLIIPTTSEQDETIRNKFTDIANNEEYRLNPANRNHCAKKLRECRN